MPQFSLIITPSVQTESRDGINSVIPFQACFTTSNLIVYVPYQVDLYMLLCVAWDCVLGEKEREVKGKKKDDK